jgi:hypothetical protein
MARGNVRQQGWLANLKEIMVLICSARATASAWFMAGQQMHVALKGLCSKLVIFSDVYFSYY